MRVQCDATTAMSRSLVFLPGTRKNLHKPMYLKPLIEVAVINALWFLMTSEKYDIEDPTKKKVADVLSE